jgi:hypothetical protein
MYTPLYNLILEFSITLYSPREFIMSNPTDALLQDAFDLIENNRLEDAQNILKPLLETESNNPAVWWVYAHAVQDPEEGMKAIDKVVQLNPTYPGASELKSQLAVTQAPLSESKIQDEPVKDWDDLDFVPDNETSDSITGGRSPIRTILIAVAVIVVVVGIFAILSGALSGDTPQPPTEVATQSTSIPTADIQIITNVSPTDEPTIEPTEVVPSDEPTIEPTEVVPTDEPTIEPTESQPSYETSLIESLATYQVAETGLQTRDTALGSTLDVTICATAGPASSAALNDVMNILVGLNSDIPEDVLAFAVTLLDCDNEQSIPRTIGVERSFVQSFADEEIELKDFQREWTPLS